MWIIQKTGGTWSVGWKPDAASGNPLSSFYSALQCWGVKVLWPLKNVRFAKFSSLISSIRNCYAGNSSVFIAGYTLLDSSDFYYTVQSSCRQSKICFLGFTLVHLRSCMITSATLHSLDQSKARTFSEVVGTALIEMHWILHVLPLGVSEVGSQVAELWKGTQLKWDPFPVDSDWMVSRLYCSLLWELLCGITIPAVLCRKWQQWCMQIVLWSLNWLIKKK